MFFIQVNCYQLVTKILYFCFLNRTSDYENFL